MIHVPVRLQNESVSNLSRKSSLWARLIKKVYEIDPLKCDQFSAAMKIIAFVVDDKRLQKILCHLGIDTDVPTLQPARDQPEEILSKEDNHSEYPFDQSESW